MKVILEVMPYPFNYGGMENLLLNLFKNYDYSDSEIDLLCLDEFDNDSAEKILKEKGVKLISEREKAGLLKQVMTLNKCLKNGSYDVVHIHSSTIISFLAFSFIAKVNHTPKIIAHSHSIGKTGIKHCIAKFAGWFAFPFLVDEFLACSVDAGKRKFPAYVIKSKLHIIKNGIDLNFYKLDNDKREIFRKNLEIKEDELLIGHVGRFTEEKNHRFIIELFAELLEKNDNYRLLLVGDGDLRPEIENYTKEKGVYDKVIFTGNVSNVQDWMQAMDLFILPSKFEGLPLTGVEAQACGLPVIFSTGVTEEVKITDNVKFISTGNMAEWIKSAEEMVLLPKCDNTEAVRSAGYDIKQTAEEIEKIYSGDNL